MGSSELTFTPRPDATPEQARNLRARAWLFVFEAHARKSPVAGSSARGFSNGTANKEDSADGRSIPRKA
jgi:hypothetical protein